MFDSRIRPLIDPPLDRIAVTFARAGVHADTVTWTGLAIGLAGAVAVGAGAYGLGLGLFVLNRLADGLDGALARRTAPSDLGGFLDIVCDFLVYAAYPLAFALADPAANALAAAILLASIISSGASFLAFATIAAKRGTETAAQGRKSIYYLAGIAEGFETIVVFVAMGLWPSGFAILAMGFAAVCVVSTVGRIAAGVAAFGAPFTTSPSPRERRW